MSARCRIPLVLKAALQGAATEEVRVPLRFALGATRFFQRRHRWGVHTGVSLRCSSTCRASTASAAFTTAPPSAAAEAVPCGAATSSPSPPAAGKATAGDVGSVSRLSISRNASGVSSWETVPNWCELCSEPINSWDAHIGKREHICLEMTLNAMVAHPRSWTATDVWCRTELFREHYARRPRNSPRTPSAHVRRMIRTGLFVPAVDSPMNIFYEAFDKGEPAARREEILLLLMHLKEKGFLSFSPEYFPLAVHHGQLVLYKETMPLLARAFPDSEVRNCSAMTAMIASTFNTETAYFLCGMEALIPPELLRVYTNKSPTPSTSTVLHKSKENGEGASGKGDDLRREGGGDDAQLGDDADDAEGSADDEAVPRTLRVNIPRAILGSLRWSLEPGATPPPPALYQHEMRYGHYNILATRVSRLLLSELIYDRLSEYVCRVEEVLRSERGQRMMRLRNLTNVSLTPSSTTCTSEGSGVGREMLGNAQMHALYTRRLAPHLSNYGMMEFTNGVGLCAAKVRGTVSADHAIHQLETQRATRLKSRKQARLQSGTPLVVSRQVRAG